MSRTRRATRKTAYFDLANTPRCKRYINRDGSTRDGAPTRPSGSCENHGGCPWCESDRTHSTEVRKLKGTDE